MEAVPWLAGGLDRIDGNRDSRRGLCLCGRLRLVKVISVGLYVWQRWMDERANHLISGSWSSTYKFSDKRAHSQKPKGKAELRLCH